MLGVALYSYTYQADLAAGTPETPPYKHFVQAICKWRWTNGGETMSWEVIQRPCMKRHEMLKGSQSQFSCSLAAALQYGKSAMSSGRISS